LSSNSDKTDHLNSNKSARDTGEPANATEDGVAPPSPSQRKTSLDSPSPSSSAPGPGDSPPFPKIREDLLNDGIADQISRRGHRQPIVIAALTVLAALTICLGGIVFTLGFAFYNALNSQTIAKFAAAELQEKINRIPLALSSKTEAAVKPTKASNDSDKKNISSNQDLTVKPAKEAEPVRIEAKIYGEVRDSMVPLVALVSILTVAIVVILGTMLKAAFAPHPNNSSDTNDKDETSPVPLLEALKSLVDSVRAAWK
jgi:hypothetical protein